MNKTILVSHQDHIATITFNRPDKLNSFNREMSYQFEEICQSISNDPQIRAILLCGAGEAFMSGTDIYELHRDMNAISAEALLLIRQFNSCILLLREMEKPVVAAVHGMVAGPGMSIMLAADLVLASENTMFLLGHNQFGLSPIGGSSYLLPRTIGTKKAMELALFSDMFDVHKAERCGLINWAVPHEGLFLRAKKIMDHLAHGPIVSFSQTKQLMNSSLQNKLASQLELEAESFVKCVNTKDFKAAVRAFVNKRAPEFEGR